jgi:hypothetical protein
VLWPAVCRCAVAWSCPPPPELPPPLLCVDPCLGFAPCAHHAALSTMRDTRVPSSVWYMVVNDTATRATCLDRAIETKPNNGASACVDKSSDKSTGRRSEACVSRFVLVPYLGRFIAKTSNNFSLSLLSILSDRSKTASVPLPNTTQEHTVVVKRNTDTHNADLAHPTPKTCSSLCLPQCLQMCVDIPKSFSDW